MVNKHVNELPREQSLKKTKDNILYTKQLNYENCCYKML